MDQIGECFTRARFTFEQTVVCVSANTKRELVARLMCCPPYDPFLAITFAKRTSQVHDSADNWSRSSAVPI